MTCGDPPCTRRRACRPGAGARGGRAQQGGGYMRPTTAVCRPPAEVGQALESRARPRRGEARQPRQRGRLSDENTTPSEHVASKVTNAPASCRAAGAGRLMPHLRRPPRQALRRACRRASGRAETTQAHGWPQGLGTARAACGAHLCRSEGFAVWPAAPSWRARMACAPAPPRLCASAS